MGIYLILKIILILINSFFLACIDLGKSLGKFRKIFASTDILVEGRVNQYYFVTIFFLTNFLPSQQVKSTAS